MRLSVQPAGWAAERPPGRRRYWAKAADHGRPVRLSGAELGRMQGQSGIVPTPLEFATDILGVELWAKQREVLGSLVEHRRVAVKSGNGLGKGFCAAVALLWFLYAHHDAAIVLSTAPTFRQVRHVLWRQVHRLYRPKAQILGGKMLDTRWEISDERYAMGLSAESADQFQGFHSPNMLRRRGSATTFTRPSRP